MPFSNLLKVALIGTALVMSAAQAHTNPISSNCTYNGFKLYGKVKFVEYFPDVKVKVVNHFPDLKVQKVAHFPDRCGQWQIVSNFPDVKVKLVDAFEDITIQWVDAFPGKTN